MYLAKICCEFTDFISNTATVTIIVQPTCSESKKSVSHHAELFQ